ncbi:thymidylate synthase, partial [Halorubellus sp. PRR65]
NLPYVQDRLANVESKADYLDVKSWVERTAPDEADGEEGYDHVPGLLEQLSREPRERPRIEIADVPLDELTYEDIEVVDYDSADGISFA